MNNIINLNIIINMKSIVKLCDTYTFASSKGTRSFIARRGETLERMI